MLGYMTDKKDYFKGNTLEYSLKKAVSYSAGTKQHYNFFKAILNYSIINTDTKTPLHDIKAGEFSIHIFPLKIQCLLSIIFYIYETNLIKEYKEKTLLANDILLPSQQLSINTIITNNPINPFILNMLDDIVLNTLDVTVLYQYLNINNFALSKFNSIQLASEVNKLFTAFNINNIIIENYNNIIKDNNRLKAIILAAQTLNYKPQSFQYLTEALLIWQQASST